MPIIKNRLGQRIIINLPGGKNRDILALSTIELSEADVASEHITNLIAKGTLVRMDDAGSHISQQKKQSINKKSSSHKSK